MKKLIVAATTAYLMFSSAAFSHQYWGDGKEVDRATKQLCCGQNDCLEVAETKMHIVGSNYVFDDTNLSIPVSRAMPSPDGLIWRCIWGNEIKCLFVPMPGM